MVALGIGAPVFLVIQGLISVFVYLELQNYSFSSRLVTGITIFVLGVVAAVVLGSIMEVISAEILAIFVYLFVQMAFRRRSSSA
ncbi:hypothetical protein NJ7G_2514 [Natrinema sp. J7-2]|nr:hypothetical protein NJ7G_2514 [Natrinema sp. J7-2]